MFPPYQEERKHTAARAVAAAAAAGARVGLARPLTDIDGACQHARRCVFDIPSFLQLGAFFFYKRAGGQVGGRRERVRRFVGESKKKRDAFEEKEPETYCSRPWGHGGTHQYQSQPNAGCHEHRGVRVYVRWVHRSD